MKSYKMKKSTLKSNRKFNMDDKSIRKTFNLFRNIGVLAVTGITLYKTFEGASSKIPTTPISMAASNVVSNIRDNPPKTFVGLTQATIDKLVSETHRGVKAEIIGDSIEYTYRSASGKKKNTAHFVLDEAGKLLYYLGVYPSASSPNTFGDKLYDKILENK